MTELKPFRRIPLRFANDSPKDPPKPADPNKEGGQGNGEAAESGLALKERTKTQKPSMYKVLLLNDDYTPMEFVVLLLERIFSKSIAEATEIMMSVHKTGVGLCGIYTHEVAETKVVQVLTFAREHQHPLQCTMEKE